MSELQQFSYTTAIFSLNRSLFYVITIHMAQILTTSIERHVTHAAFLIVLNSKSTVQQATFSSMQIHFSHLITKVVQSHINSLHEAILINMCECL